MRITEMVCRGQDGILELVSQTRPSMLKRSSSQVTAQPPHRRTQWCRILGPPNIRGTNNDGWQLRHKERDKSCAIRSI